MDIHAPEKPLHSLKEVAVHIGVVTIGILIALSLEGLREVIHDRALVRETRENFTVELQFNREQSTRELARDREALAQLNQLLQDLPELERKDPSKIATRVNQIRNAGYFLPADAWQTALSTGALAHFSTDELNRYSSAFYITRVYSDLQRSSRPSEDNAQVFFASRPNLSPAELAEGTERLLLFKRSQEGLVQVCEQMREQYDKVLPAQ